MELFLDIKAVQHIRLATAEAIEEGDTEALKEDILYAFPEEKLEALEPLVGDFEKMLDVLLEEWSGDDVDELFDLLESHLGDHGIDLRLESAEDDDGEPDDYQDFEYDDSEL